MTYDDALAEASRKGVARCGDAAAMASFCENTIQILVGAVSPRLVWEGARKKKMTFVELAELCNRDPRAVADLMWL